MVREEEQTGQFGRVDKKLIEATILPSLLLSHYPSVKSSEGTDYLQQIPRL